MGLADSDANKDKFCSMVDAVKAEYEEAGKVFDVDAYFAEKGDDVGQFWIDEWKRRQQ